MMTENSDKWRKFMASLYSAADHKFEETGAFAKLQSAYM